MQSTPAPALDSSVIRCAEALLEVLPPVSQFLRSAIQRPEGADRLGLSQYRVLWLLQERPHTSSELARHLEVTRPSITNIVDVLVHRTYAERGESATDRRVVWVRITPEGTLCMQRARRQVLTEAEALVARLSEAERAALLDGLGLLCKALPLASEAARG